MRRLVGDLLNAIAFVCRTKRQKKIAFVRFGPICGLVGFVEELVDQQVRAVA